MPFFIFFSICFLLYSQSCLSLNRVLLESILLQSITCCGYCLVLCYCPVYWCTVFPGHLKVRIWAESQMCALSPFWEMHSFELELKFLCKTLTKDPPALFQVQWSDSSSSSVMKTHHDLEEFLLKVGFKSFGWGPTNHVQGVCILLWCLKWSWQLCTWSFNTNWNF